MNTRHMLVTIADYEHCVLRHGRIQKILSGGWGGGGGGVLTVFSHQRFSQRAVQTSLEKQLDPS